MSSMMENRGREILSISDAYSSEPGILTIGHKLNIYINNKLHSVGTITAIFPGTHTMSGKVVDVYYIHNEHNQIIAMYLANSVNVIYSYDQ